MSFLFCIPNFSVVPKKGDRKKYKIDKKLTKEEIVDMGEDSIIFVKKKKTKGYRLAAIEPQMGSLHTYDSHLMVNFENENCVSCSYRFHEFYKAVKKRGLKK